jgi:hypothetical protein
MLFGHEVDFFFHNIKMPYDILHPLTSLVCATLILEI